ncbi:MAG: cation diffusion facilitator family transporter [Victivallaceae bacterium]|nr:cation diffusion facilitator family transporter [Victivallaceae bacterium]
MLTTLLIRLFVKNHSQPIRPDSRLSYGILCGYVGILVNIALFVIKTAIGLLSGSIAIGADAVNNLSDAGSALITLCGFKMSARPADLKHPFGHGRFEYIAGLIVAVIIVAVGIDFLKESVSRIFEPSSINADKLFLWLYGGTLLVKTWLFRFYRVISQKISSTTIEAAAFDSLSDLWIGAAVLLSVIAAGYTKFPVDSCAGSLVAIMVIIGGIKVMRDTIDPLLGESPDQTIVEELEKRISECPGISGVHDIIIHNYGPNQYYVTAHAELNCKDDLQTVHDTLEAAENTIALEMPVRLMLHCDPQPQKK